MNNSFIIFNTIILCMPNLLLLFNIFIMSNSNSELNKTFDKNNLEIQNNYLKLFELYTNNKTSSDKVKKVISETLSRLLCITDDFFNKILLVMNSLDELYADRVINSEDKLAISFNGGKDCLAAYIVTKYYFYCKKFGREYNLNSFISFCNLNNTNNLDKIQSKENNFSLKEFGVYCIYFINDDYFEEEESYVIDFIKRENIDNFYFYSDTVSGLKFLIKNYNMKLVIMGTRNDDITAIPWTCSNGFNKNDLLQPTTQPYPNLLRFYPVYYFNFDDVWRIILVSRFKYSELYDKGFSSIGKKHNTKVNENLLYDSSILPAWCLKKYDSEREFRK